MRRNKLRRAISDQVTSPLEEGSAIDGDYDKAMSKFSANCYERRGRLWARFHQGDLWVAIGLYLIMSGVAFVVL